MKKPTALLMPGNRKLGEGFASFSIPAGETCPGMTELCGADCYAKGFLFQIQRDRHAANLEATRAKDFEQRVIAQIRYEAIDAVRLHVAGDFYSARYVARWGRIAQACPFTTFLAYTRSWRVPAMLPALERWGALPNTRLWYSEDRETGPSPRSAVARVAYYLATQEDEEHIGRGVDLVFRKLGAKWGPVKRIGGAIVCPPEQGIQRQVTITCSTCRLCTRPAIN